MDAELVLSYGALAIVLGSYLMVFRPFRAGRRPLAVYDQVCTYLAIFGVAWVCTNLYGAKLWITGLGAVIGAVTAARALDFLLLRFTTEDSLKQGAFYAGSGLTCFAFAWAGGLVGASLLAFAQASR